MIRPLTENREITEAFLLFSRSVMQGGHQAECVVAYTGGSETATVTWHEKQKFWVLIQPERIEDRLWCAFGVEDPTANTHVAITFEINPPRSGVNRQCAGLFIVDNADSVYIAHNGKIAGGRPAAGKTPFIGTQDKNDVVPVDFGDRKLYEYIAIARLDDTAFLDDLARFVHAVATYKDEIAKSKAAR